jgi:hypothetical protein
VLPPDAAHAGAPCGAHLTTDLRLVAELELVLLDELLEDLGVEHRASFL